PQAASQTAVFGQPRRVAAIPIKSGPAANPSDKPKTVESAAAPAAPVAAPARPALASMQRPLPPVATRNPATPQRDAAPPPAPAPIALARAAPEPSQAASVTSLFGQPRRVSTLAVKPEPGP